MKSHDEKPLVIIGAGIAGVAAALELTRKYPTQKIRILERSTMFSGSTGRNPARMGHGFHYMDLETSKQYLRASIEVQRRYPDFLIGFGENTGRGRYYIHKQSKPPAAVIWEHYRAIKAAYQKMCDEDPLNQVFGTPDKFISKLKKDKFEGHVNADLVADDDSKLKKDKFEGHVNADLVADDDVADGDVANGDVVDVDVDVKVIVKKKYAIETAEHLFDFPKFAAHIRKIIDENPNIRLVENVEVTNIQYWMDTDNRFSIEMKSTVSGDALASLKSDHIVNSSWENIEFLNSKIGIPYQDGSRTNRLKCLLEVQLPVELKNVNSSFFCMGPFCMFSNMGDGRGMLTFADVTNYDVSSAVKIDKKMEDYLTGNFSSEESTDISLKIRDGVARYITGMEESSILKLHFGIVQTDGDLKLKDIHSASSGLHARREIGVREEIQGLISNPARKLFYFVYNGIEVVIILDMQFERDLKIQELVAAFITMSTAEDIKHLRIFIDRWIVGIENISTIDNDLLLAKLKDGLQSHASLHHLVSSVVTSISPAFASDEQTTTVIKSPLTATSAGATPEISIVRDRDTDPEIESLLLAPSGPIPLERERSCTALPWENGNQTILASMRCTRPISAGSIFLPTSKTCGKLTQPLPPPPPRW